MMHTGWMKILYIFLLIAGALFSVLYSGPFSVLLLCTLLLIPVLMLLCALYIRFHLDVSICLTGSTYHRNTPQAIQLIVKNSGFLPVGRAVASIMCFSQMSKIKAPIELSFPIPAKNVTTVEFKITAAHCGMTKMQMQWLRFSDYIHLFSWKIRKHPETAVLILPTGMELDFPIAVPDSKTEEESSLYSKCRAGDDPSEIYRIREYQPGDLQKRIHWKLSSRTDTVWVKEYSDPIQHRAAVIMDYSVPVSHTSDDAMDVMLETAYTLSMAFVKQNLPLTLYWYDAHAKQSVWNEIHSVSELNDCFITLLSQPPAQDAAQFFTQLSEQTSIRSTNAVYYCTPQFIQQNMEILSDIFLRNKLHVLTAEAPPESQPFPENVHHIEETSIVKVLQHLTGAKEVQNP